MLNPEYYRLMAVTTPQIEVYHSGRREDQCLFSAVTTPQIEVYHSFDVTLNRVFVAVTTPQIEVYHSIHILTFFAVSNYLLIHFLKNTFILLLFCHYYHFFNSFINGFASRKEVSAGISPCSAAFLVSRSLVSLFPSRPFLPSSSHISLKLI